MYEFNCIANRLMRASHSEFSPVLRKFLGHVNSNELISEYINSCKRENYDVEAEIKAVTNNHGRYKFDLGYTNEEEIYTIYNILLYIAENGFDLFSIGRAYSSESKFDNIVKDFNNKISLVLIQHISGYLTKIGIEMGFDEEVNYMITNNGGQVNISRETSTINAVQNICSKPDELASLVSEINKVLASSSVSTEDKEMIEESVQSIQSELQNPSPRKGLIKTCIKGLDAAIIGIPHAIELCDNVQKFIDFVSTKLG